MAGYTTEESSVVEEFNIACPYCGELIELLIDGSIEEQEYYEDCSVCCSPILCVQSIGEEGKIKLIVKKDND